MKILFIHPPVRLQGKPEDIPFGLSILASIAEQEKMQVAILDLNANRVPLQTVAEEIALDDYDIIAGTFFICGLSNDNFASLPPDLMKKFKEKFAQPEIFMQLGNHIVAIPMEPKGESKPPKRDSKLSHDER